MKIAYDEYYQTENLFGEPYPELIDFFTKKVKNSKVLDLGCGQGRDAIALAELGFDVTGIDYSQVGIDQMNEIAKAKKIALKGLVADIFLFDDFGDYDVVLLNSMFHFAKNDKAKEIAFIKNIIAKIKQGSIIIFCIQDTGKKIEILNTVLSSENLENLEDKKMKYTFEDKETGHSSTSDYRMIVVKKSGH